MSSQRFRAIRAIALSLAIGFAAQATASEDARRRLVEVLSMDVPVRPVLAPSLVLPKLEDGTPLRLADLDGRLFLLYFWTTW